MRFLKAFRRAIICLSNRVCKLCTSKHKKWKMYNNFKNNNLLFVQEPGRNRLKIRYKYDMIPNRTRLGVGYIPGTKVGLSAIRDG